MGDDAQQAEADANIQIWKIKKLIKSLEAARGNGTSMISLILPPKSQISAAAKMLGDEYGTASNIKSRVNRQSVLGAITSTQQRLKLFTKVPPNGLVIYCGTILTEDNKEKKVNIDFEPFKPINTSLYLCDNKFHTEALNELLESDDKFGFIVMDGNGSLFGTVAGNHREVLHKFSVDLPKKHGRGGQSALRFARLRLEKRQNYVRKVAETAGQMFLTNDKCNVSGIILAGSADFKNVLYESEVFDQRLVAKVIKTVDVSYGGENGFNQAIELCAETLANVKFIQEKRLISKYFEEISQDTGKFCFGIEDTLKALEMGAVEILICYENLETDRLTLKNSASGEETVLHLSKQQQTDQSHFVTAGKQGFSVLQGQEAEVEPTWAGCPPLPFHSSMRMPVFADGTELEIVDKQQLVEWFAENYKTFGAQLEFVTNRSQEGSQFVKGFGGIGGILRYKVDFMEHEFEDADEYM